MLVLSAVASKKFLVVLSTVFIMLISGRVTLIFTIY